MAKLTLSVNESAVKGAKEYARRHRTSVSKLVTDYLEHLQRREREEVEPAPLLREIQSAMKRTGISMDDYYSHLERKHQ